MLGVEVNTVVGWEVGRAEPKVSYLPAILEFLGTTRPRRQELLGSVCAPRGTAGGSRR